MRVVPQGDGLFRAEIVESNARSLCDEIVITYEIPKADVCGQVHIPVVLCGRHSRAIETHRPADVARRIKKGTVCVF